MSRYPDKSWKQNHLNKLEVEDGDSTITRSVYDRWEGHGIGVFKAMKIAFVPRMALALEYINGTFSPIVAGTLVDATNTQAFKQQVVALAVATGFTFLDPQDNAHLIAAAQFQRNFDEIIDIFDDIMVKLSGAVHYKQIDLIFKIEREQDHPLMALRVMKRIKGSIYKVNQLPECIATAQDTAKSVPAWTHAAITDWLRAIDTARLNIRHCGADDATADARVVMSAIRALRSAPATAQHHAEWQYASLKWRDEFQSDPAAIT